MTKEQVFEVKNMSKFNSGVEDKNVTKNIREELKQRPDATLNYEGALAFKLDPLTELYLKSASTLVGEPKFYTNAKESDRDLLKSIENVAKLDPEFILQLAVYCREQLHLRSVPLMLIAEFANSVSCVGRVPNARKYVSRCLQRADELTELVAYQLARNKLVPRTKTVLPMMIRFGIRNAFLNFDGYQLAKYDNDQKAVKMRDSMFLTHPNPTSVGIKQSTVFEKLADGTLESPDTWEVMRSTGRMTWHDVINKVFYKNGRVNNYMAILRNLRNCLQSKDVTEADIRLLCRMISDKNAVLYSKQLPFRFFAAYRELYDASNRNFTPAGSLMVTDLMDAIETAVIYSIDNFPKLSGSSTLIACDVSASMEKEISKNSSMQRYDIGIMLGMMANRFAGQTITGMFGDDWKVVPMSRNSGILKNTMEMHSREGEVGYSTNGYKVIEYLINKDIAVDRIMIFTDNQMWNSRARRSIWRDDDSDDGTTFAEKFLLYQQRYPGVKLYSFDMSGYGSISIPQNTRGVCVIGGWSDKIFDFISAFEEIGTEKGNVAIKKIKAIKP
jgi:60 kDa SS-A/Ro ribonucleoprotein